MDVSRILPKGIIRDSTPLHIFELSNNAKRFIIVQMFFIETLPYRRSPQKTCSFANLTSSFARLGMYFHFWHKSHFHSVTPMKSYACIRLRRQ